MTSFQYNAKFKHHNQNYIKHDNPNFVKIWIATYMHIHRKKDWKEKLCQQNIILVSQIVVSFQLVPSYLTELRTRKINLLHFFLIYPIKFNTPSVRFLKKEKGLIYWHCRQIRKNWQQPHDFVSALLLVLGRMFPRSQVSPSS